MRVSPLAAGVLVLLVVGGCTSDSGPKEYRVSGEAKVDGQPIPHGDVLFTPDGAAGNSGPQGIATIKDGKYDTSASDGKGVAGGPTIVKVTGFDKPGSTVPLCEYEYKVDLPKADSTLAIDVPGLKGPPKKVGPEI
jgi:hypothetical protein